MPWQWFPEIVAREENIRRGACHEEEEEFVKMVVDCAKKGEDGGFPRELLFDPMLGCYPLGFLLVVVAGQDVELS